MKAFPGLGSFPIVKPQDIRLQVLRVAMSWLQGT